MSHFASFKMGLYKRVTGRDLPGASAAFMEKETGVGGWVIVFDPDEGARVMCMHLPRLPRPQDPKQGV